MSSQSSEYPIITKKKGGKARRKFILKEKIMITLFFSRIYCMPTLNYQPFLLHSFHH